MVQVKFELDQSEDFRTLQNAPIVEAILHWQAAAQSDPDSSEWEKELRRRFSDYEIELQHNFETALTKSAEGVELKHSTAWEGFRLTKQEDGQPIFVCQFKRDGLIFSRLQPYQGWDKFEPEAIRFWEVFVDLSEAIEVAQLSTRYISKIPISSLPNVSDYIGEVPQPLAPIGIVANSFYHQDSADLGDLPYTVNTVRAVQPMQDSKSYPASLIIDISVSTRNSIVDLDLVPQKLGELRYIKNKIFFALMDKAIQQGLIT